jgi:hypothetical protein
VNKHASHVWSKVRSVFSVPHFICFVGTPRHCETSS